MKTFERKNLTRSYVIITQPFHWIEHTLLTCVDFNGSVPVTQDVFICPLSASHRIQTIRQPHTTRKPCWAWNTVLILVAAQILSVFTCSRKKYNTLLISKALQMYENGSILIFILHGPFGSGLDLQFTAVKFEHICFSVE